MTTYRQRPTILELRQVEKRFGAVQALHPTDFQLHEQEIVAIVGDNGAGKSTMVKIISGVHQPSTGGIFVRGDLATVRNPMEARRLGIETVFQDLALVDTRDIVANLFLGREVTRKRLPFVLDRKRMSAQAKRSLDHLRIALPALHTAVGFLSGGQRQAIAVARAASWNAPIVLMDEPTAALGVKESREVLELIRRMRETGTSIIVVAHNLEHVFSVADRVVVMRMGRIVGSCSTNTTSKEQVVGMITGAH
jgi:ABC-type sugar transport system ATPase subunit